MNHRLGATFGACLAAFLGLVLVAAPAGAATKPQPKPAKIQPSTARIPAGCWGNGNSGDQTVPTCNGKDPQSLGCSSGARTLDYGTSRNGIFIELRYSPACNAAWTRYTNIYGDPGTLYIRGNLHTYSKVSAAYDGEEGWTRMVSFTETVRACVVFYSLGEYLEYCTNSY